MDACITFYNLRHILPKDKRIIKTVKVMVFFIGNGCQNWQQKTVGQEKTISLHCYGSFSLRKTCHL